MPSRKVTDEPSRDIPSHSEMARQLETDSDEARWTFDEVGALLRISGRTVQRTLADKGLLKAKKEGGKMWRVRVRDLRAYLNRDDEADAEEAVSRLLETKRSVMPRAKKGAKKKS